jgi:hypothetical protein
MKRLACLICAAIVATAASAHAQDNFQAVGAAKTLFEQGQKQMEEKNYDAACQSFKASNEAVARVGTLLNLADCYEKAGKLASAWGAYYSAISLGRRQNKPEYEEFAQKNQDRLAPLLSKMTIVVPPEVKVDGMKVTRDGQIVEPIMLGVAVAVDPGKHVIEATAPHKLAFHTEVTVDDAHKNVEVKVEKLAEAPMQWARTTQPQIVEKVVEVPSAITPLRIGGIVLGSLGLASVIVGSALGLVANDKYQSALKNDCGGNSQACSPVGVTNGANAHDLANVATGLFVGGLVAVAGGVTLFIIGAPSRPETQPTASFRMTPLPGGAAASFAGTF